MYSLIVTTSIRKPGWPTSLPASPNIRLVGSTSCCHGTGSRARHCTGGRPDLTAISAVFTIGYVADLFGEDEDWLHELSIDLFPEDGCLRVYGVGEDGVVAFTRDGIECLKQIIGDKRAAGSAPPELKSSE
jgi:hypothetical protein